MVERAATGLVERRGARAVSGVDVLITHTQLPDLPVVGCGGTVARRFGALLTVSDASPILDVECKHHPEFAGDMTVVTGDGRRYWAPGSCASASPSRG
ncbi:hypothetical protein [Actinokineospora spheciospongiae]|uniref:hypothetical protein n=1 Tax=Actinokineospora spheciospongiae TaxID=909613 RepID=UPI001F2E5E22|nr:hypothetical protein [Actinokineospora spheciospongiae]